MLCMSTLTTFEQILKKITPLSGRKSRFCDGADHVCYASSYKVIWLRSQALQKHILHELLVCLIQLTP
jgi:hypothetical protein